jgi:soluble lytic murein transglycosylase-like protein
LILQESDGDPRAVRYEGHQDTAPDGDNPRADDGFFEDDKSYGLMQVMGYNARALCGVPKGTRMEFSFLLLPLTNLSFGLRIITANLAETSGHIPSAIARFNGGGRGNPPGGEILRNQSYVDSVARQAARVQLAREGA